MKKNYDFSKAVKNPYTRRLKQQLACEADEVPSTHFQETAKDPPSEDPRRKTVTLKDDEDASS